MFGAALPGAFYKRDESLPTEMRYFDGNPPEKFRFGSPWPQGKFTWVSETTEVAPGFLLILLKGSWGVDLDVMEVSLAIDTPDGTVLVVGCSHPTIEKIVEAAKPRPTSRSISSSAGPISCRRSRTRSPPPPPHCMTIWKVQWMAPVPFHGRTGLRDLERAFWRPLSLCGPRHHPRTRSHITTKAEAGRPGPGQRSHTLAPPSSPRRL